MTYNLANTIAFIQNDVQRFERGEVTAKDALKSAEYSISQHEAFLRNALHNELPNRDAAKAAAKERSVYFKGNVSRETLIDRLAEKAVAATEEINEAIKPLREAVKSINDDRYAKEGFEAALKDWREGKDQNLHSYDDAQGMAALDFLQSVAGEYDRWVAEEKDDPTVHVLRFVMSWGIHHHEASLPYTSQTRIGDVPKLLGRQAAAAYALKIVGPAALGVQGALKVGIQREWYHTY